MLLALSLIGCATVGPRSRPETVDGASVLCPPSESGGGARLHVAIVDQQGASVSQASVTVRRLSSEAVFTIVADDTGHLNIEHLLPGPYRVEVTRGAFHGSSATRFPVRAGCTTSVTIPVGPT